MSGLKLKLQRKLPQKNMQQKNQLENFTFENNPLSPIDLQLKQLKYKVLILIQKRSVGQSINDQKCAFQNKMKNNDYLRRNNFRLVIYQQ